MATNTQAEQLEAVRVQRDWSYRKLAAEFEQTTGVRRSVNALRNICNGEAEPNRRTHTAIVTFLSRVREPKKKSR